MKTVFQLRFTGGGVTPETVSAGELADLLLAAEAAIVGVALHRNPTLNPDDIVVGLVGIENRSLGLKFSSPIPDIIAPAYEELTTSVRSRSFRGLASKSIRGIRVIAEFTTSRKCRAQFWNGTEAATTPLAEIAEGFEKSLPESQFIRGETTIYGKVERVGGVDPKVRVRLSEHEVVSCYLNQVLAKELGKRLYAEVGLRRQATWDAEDHSLVYFRVEEFLPYREGKTASAFDELRAACGGAFDTVRDVVSWVAEERGVVGV